MATNLFPRIKQRDVLLAVDYSGRLYSYIVLELCDNYIIGKLKARSKVGSQKSTAIHTIVFDRHDGLCPSGQYLLTRGKREAESWMRDIEKLDPEMRDILIDAARQARQMYIDSGYFPWWSED